MSQMASTGVREVQGQLPLTLQVAQTLELGDAVFLNGLQKSTRLFNRCTMACPCQP